GGTKLILWKDLPEPLRQRYQAEARKRKDAEIQKLKQDLARAEAEAAKLNQTDSKPKTDTAPPPAVPDKPAVEKPRVNEVKQSKPDAELVSQKPGETVDVAELVQQYKTDSASAERSYQKKTFRIRGVVERFEPILFVRKYTVLLESPEK